MTRDEMFAFLECKGMTRLLPIFIPSYNRPNFRSAELFKNFTAEEKKRIFVVVRPSQAKVYRKANPELTILPIPKDIPINGLASTRQFICDYAAEHRMPYIIDMDDDITKIECIFQGKTKKGDECSSHSVKIDHEKDPRLIRKIFATSGYLAKQLFRTHPEVYIGNMRRQRLSNSVDNHRLAYIINSGPTPRQVTFINIKGLRRADIQRDMIFDPHGDDIGFVRVVLSKGGSCFNFPSFAYDYVSEKCDSVVRTPETEKRLHKYEYDMLQTYPIRDYLRTTFRDADGDYMWGDINWTAYHKLQGTSRTKVLWTDLEDIL